MEAPKSALPAELLPDTQHGQPSLREPVWKSSLVETSDVHSSSQHLNVPW
jgi:hypothetical protein